MNESNTPSWLAPRAAVTPVAAVTQSTAPAADLQPGPRPNSSPAPVELPGALEPLRSLTVWLLWKSFPNPKGGKPIKVPYYANGGTREKPLDGPSDKAQLVTYDTAVQAFTTGQFKGLALALGPLGDGRYLQGIDLDGIEENGLQDIVDTLPGYVEISPSGKGFHALGIGPSFTTLSANSSGVEAYSGARFFTVTLDAVRGELADLRPFTETVLKPLHDAAKATKTVDGGASSLIDEGGRNTALHALGSALRHSGASPAGIEALLMVENATRCVPPLDDQEVRKIAGQAGKYEVINDVAGVTSAALGMFGPVAVAGAGHQLPFTFMDGPGIRITPPDELVEGLLTTESVAMLFGASNSGKTFLAVELASCIARGANFLGRRVQQGVAVHVAAEAAGSVRTRYAALAKHHGVDVPVAVVDSTPDLFSSDHDADALIATIKGIEVKRGKVRLIVLDTLAAISGAANENTSEMMSVMRRIERLKNELKTCAMPIHHSGKNSAAGGRGFSGIRASLDTEMEINEDGVIRTLTTTKQRDLPKGQTLTFGLQVVETGTTNFGATATTCVVVPAGQAAQTRATPMQALEYQVMTLIKNHAAKDELITVSDVRGARLAGVEKTTKAIEALTRQGLLFEEKVDGAVFAANQSKRVLFIVGTDTTEAMLKQARKTAGEQLTGRHVERVAQAIENLERKATTGVTSFHELFDKGANMQTDQ